MSSESPGRSPTGSLLRLLQSRADTNRSLRVGLIGAGKFGTMFLAQARRISGLHVLGICDLSIPRAQASLHLAGWPPEQYAARDADDALRTGATWLTDDAEALIRAPGLELVIEATGVPSAGLRHALAAFEHGRHVVMVTAEADALAGPALARRAAAAGLVYSLAYGDQPALVCELVDWARTCGFEVVCAGKGTKYLLAYHASTPEDVWQHYGFTPEQVAAGDYNARMFTSFLDGTKSAIEMAAVANAAGLVPQPHGLGFPPCGTDRLPHVCRPQSAGGTLAHAGTVEVVSSLERDGRPVPNGLRWGVYVVVEASSNYVRRCFAEYGLLTDESGMYAAMSRPFHLVGLELAISVLRVGLRGEATGTPVAHLGDVVATAKRDLAAEEVLDGEGGYCVYGRLLPAAEGRRVGGLPIGLAHGVRLKRAIAAGEIVGWADVDVDETDLAVRVRREMEQSPEAPRG